MESRKRPGRPKINKGYKSVRMDLETYDRFRDLAGGTPLGEFLRAISKHVDPEIYEFALLASAYEDLGTQEHGPAWIESILFCEDNERLMEFPIDIYLNDKKQEYDVRKSMERITPKTPPITPKRKPISPKPKRITPRAPRITPKFPKLK